jgi:hypothetical protein
VQIEVPSKSKHQKATDSVRRGHTFCDHGDRSMFD